MPALDIRGSGRSFFILQNGVAVGGPYTGHGNAIAALRGVERRLNPTLTKFRSCSGCGRGFLTTGTPNCPSCRKGGRHGQG
jgi:hypothetical protein